MSETTGKPNPLPMPLLLPEQYIERRRAIKDWIERVLDKGIDYGEGRGKTDPNATREQQKKWTLLKPGAQKLAEAFGLTTRERITHREVTWNGMSGRILYEVESSVIDSNGVILAITTGTCSTDESRYGYSWKYENEVKAMGLDPKSLLSEIKTGRSGNYTVYRVVNPATGDLIQTIRGMAAKRAYVEAIETALALGSIFAEEDDAEPGRTEEHREEMKTTVADKTAPALGGLGQPAKPAEPAPNADLVNKARESLNDPPAPEVDPNKCRDCGVELPESVKVFSTKNYGAPLCREHQKNHQKVQPAGGGR